MFILKPSHGSFGIVSDFSSVCITLCKGRAAIFQYLKDRTIDITVSLLRSLPLPKLAIGQSETLFTVLKSKAISSHLKVNATMPKVVMGNDGVALD